MEEEYVPDDGFLFDVSEGEIIGWEGAEGDKDC